MNSIKIGGKNRPVNIGWDMLKAFGKRTGRAFGEVFEVSNLTFEEVEALIYEALVWGAKENGESFDADPGEVANWISKEMRSVVEFITFFGDEIQAQLGEDEKN